MKKKVLCVFALVLYLMTACTLLSAKIEEEMTVLVRTHEKYSSKRTGQDVVLDSRSIFVDESDHLFEAVEGDGWATGLRAQEVYNFSLNYNGTSALLYSPRDTFFIYTASRPPRDGMLVKEVKEFETASDQILLHYPRGVPGDWDFPENMEIAGESEYVYLMDTQEVLFPFLPHSIKTMTVGTDLADRVISLTETKLFLEELPKAAKVGTVLLFGVLLCVASWFLAIRPEENKALIWANVGIACLSLLYLRYVLGTIDLPASMLPSRSILDISHYKETLGLVFSSIRAIGIDKFDLIGTSARVLGEVKKAVMMGGAFSLAFLLGEGAIAAAVNRNRGE